MRPAVLLIVVAAAGCGRPEPHLPPAVGPRLLWAWEAPRPGAVVAAPLATADAVYLAAVHPEGFRLAGAVYAVDPATGKRRWAFDRDGEMLPTASPPLVAGGRLFVGEGMHANFACRLYALDPTTGRQQWTADTGDHVEGGAAVAGDLVVFPAGNDGIIAVEPATGKVRWRFAEDLHIDTTPAVAGDRLYVGSGPSRKFREKAILCLDARTGRPVWRTPAPLPVWGEPVVHADGVYVGLGNGRLTEGVRPPDTPAGALACYAAADGSNTWTYPVGDAVFGRPAVVGSRVVFGSRDGHLYGLTLDGRPVWKVPMGGPVMAGVAAEGGKAYAVSVPGRLVCVDADDGREVWRHELARGGATPHAYAAPRVADGRLVVAAELRPPGSSAGVVTLSCFDLPR